MFVFEKSNIGPVILFEHEYHVTFFTIGNCGIVDTRCVYIQASTMRCILYVKTHKCHFAFQGGIKCYRACTRVTYNIIGTIG